MNNAGKREILEYNDSTSDNSIVISPSYLVDLKLQPKFMWLQNTLRHTDKDDNNEDSEDGEDDMIDYKVIYQNYVKNDAGWFDNIYFNIFSRNHDRITEKKNVIVIDKKNNKLLGVTVRDVSEFAEEKDETREPDKCNENVFKQINDTLFEFKTSEYMAVPLANPGTGPTYYYMKLKEGKLADITDGWFSFTKYVKLDDSYLKGCYDINDISTQYPEGNWVVWMLEEMFIRYDLKVKDKYGVLDERNEIATKIYKQTFSDVERYNVEWLKKRLDQMKKSR